MTAQRSLDLHITPRAGKQFVRYLRRHLPPAHALLNSVLTELSIVLVGDAEMSRLHVQFMGIAGPTDVLTFPLDEDAEGRIRTGEIVICVPEARRQARKMRTAAERELLLYAIHGMLHLRGFDDRTAAGFRNMHRTEDQILTRLGLGPVFAPRMPARRRDQTGDE